uniref:Uncharacterized protein n=1 Tax=Lotharella oceanica TaxID=641309 RepID=A0A7S2TH16_9EUKA
MSVFSICSTRRRMSARNEALSMYVHVDDERYHNIHVCASSRPARAAEATATGANAQPMHIPRGPASFFFFFVVDVSILRPSSVSFSSLFRALRARRTARAPPAPRD